MLDIEAIDREALNARIAELEPEYEALTLLRDMLYCADEGIVEIDAAGRCFPTSFFDPEHFRA